MVIVTDMLRPAHTSLIRHTQFLGVETGEQTWQTNPPDATLKWLYWQGETTVAFAGVVFQNKSSWI